LPAQGGVGHVPGGVGQRQAPLRAAQLFAVGIGVVGTQRHCFGDAPAPGQFRAPDAHLVDVDVLCVGRVAQQPVVTEVGAGAYAAGLLADQAGLAAGDLVVEVVAED